MRWGAVRCWLGSHQYGLPVVEQGRLYCRCLRCHKTSKGITTNVGNGRDPVRYLQLVATRRSQEGTRA